MKDELTHVIKDMQTAWIDFATEVEKAKTNKAAALRCRKCTYKLRDSGKEYRKLSLKK